MLTDGKGIPLSVAVDGANRHDNNLVKRTLDAIIIERPSPVDIDQNMCMDKGYDFPDITELLEECGYIYDPEVGDLPRAKPGTAFEDLPDDWVCPVCGAPKDINHISMNSFPSGSLNIA